MLAFYIFLISNPKYIKIFAYPARTLRRVCLRLFTGWYATLSACLYFDFPFVGFLNFFILLANWSISQPPYLIFDQISTHRTKPSAYIFPNWLFLSLILSLILQACTLVGVLTECICDDKYGISYIAFYPSLQLVNSKIVQYLLLWFDSPADTHKHKSFLTF